MVEPNYAEVLFSQCFPSAATQHNYIQLHTTEYTYIIILIYYITGESEWNV